MNLPQGKAFIVDEMLALIQEFRNNTESEIEYLTKEMVDDFFNLCHYWPLKIKRDKNVSNQMYRVFTSAKASDHTSSKAF